MIKKQSRSLNPELRADRTKLAAKLSRLPRPGLLADDATYISHVYAKLHMLFDYYGIHKESNPNDYFRLALALANDYVDGFEAKLEKG